MRTAIVLLINVIILLILLESDAGNITLILHTVAMLCCLHLAINEDWKNGFGKE